MIEILFDRFLMGFSLFIHIILASLGMALPVFILIAEYLGIRKFDNYYTVIAKRFSIVLAVLFAIGTASGSLVAVNITVLWPKFMALIGQVAIAPFYIEVFAFFLETIFLAIYLYSWGKLPKEKHMLLMIPVVIGGALSAMLITMINAFMNTPSGFNVNAYLANGTLTGIDPLAVFNTPSTWIEVSHVLSTSYLAGFTILAAYFAIKTFLSKEEEKSKYYKKSLAILIPLCMIAAIFAIYSGLSSIATLMNLQPEKFAAIEANLNPMSNAPEMIGGIFFNGSYHYYFLIPRLQSLLATGSFNGTVPGLNQFPTSTWPPLIVHIMFDLLVFIGFAIGIAMLLLVFMYFLKIDILSDWRAHALLVLSALGSVFLLENGWVMSELARQPWIIYNVMLVSDAANPSAVILPISVLIFLFYLAIIPLTCIVLIRIMSARDLSKELTQ